jgi:hypothetical protein
VFFIKPLCCSSVHIIKISVKLVEIRVFSEKSPKIPQDVSEIPEIPGKKVQFSGFQDDAQRYNFWKIRGKKFPGKSDVFGKISKSKIGKFGNSGKFRKKVPKRRFWKIQPSFAERVLKHILRS